MKKILFLLLAMQCLYSCQQVKNEQDNQFIIQSNVQNIIQGDQGSILIIPQNALVYEDGPEITEDVTIKLTEAYKLKDILDNGLDTRTADKFLVTGGMIELQASTASGKKVVVAKDKTIDLRVGQPFSDSSNYKFFSQEGQQWANPKPPGPYLTYAPVDEHIFYISLKDTNNITNWIDNIVLSTSKPEIVSTMLYDSFSFNEFINRGYHDLEFLTDTILENSFASSIEYGERFMFLTTFDEISIYFQFVYLKNMDKPLWVVDSMIIEECKSMLPEYEDSPDNYKLIKRILRQTTNFKNQYKTTLSPDKFTEKELAALKNCYQKLAVNQFIQTYKIRQLGWHNIDYFYDKIEMTSTSFSVDCNEGTRRVALILKDVKSVIRGKANDMNQFCFGFGGECEARLPNVKAYLIGMGEKDGQLLFAQKEIQIGENEVEELELKPSTEAEVSAVLDAIEAGYER